MGVVALRMTDTKTRFGESWQKTTGGWRGAGGSSAIILQCRRACLLHLFGRQLSIRVKYYLKLIVPRRFLSPVPLRRSNTPVVHKRFSSALALGFPYCALTGGRWWRASQAVIGGSDRSGWRAAQSSLHLFPFPALRFAPGKNESPLALSRGPGPSSD
ncbi:hypothetical protein NDU88_002607 [Pleurodeles waltl]|uniref:Uncharacterized protein n=1 Tax=Pleurodeles waltl TaxID=8319 RepID=A0AAV7VZU5_PLEWA|nr:hypothetical protein NDU88_002607 [Pleurodeles waltl]